MAVHAKNQIRMKWSELAPWEFAFREELDALWGRLIVVKLAVVAHMGA
jgi:hypothetical protein